MRIDVYHHVAGASALEGILAELKLIKQQEAKIMGDTQQLIVEVNRTKDLAAKALAAVQAGANADQPAIDAATADLKAANDALQAGLPAPVAPPA